MKVKGYKIEPGTAWFHPRYDAKYNQNDIGLLHLKTLANVSRLGILPTGSLKSIGKKFLIDRILIPIEGLN